jgi:hypothetical protein
MLHLSLYKHTRLKCVISLQCLILHQTKNLRIRKNVRKKVCEKSSNRHKVQNQIKKMCKFSQLLTVRQAVYDFFHVLELHLKKKKNSFE